MPEFSIPEIVRLEKLVSDAVVEFNKLSNSHGVEEKINIIQSVLKILGGKAQIENKSKENGDNLNGIPQAPEFQEAEDGPENPEFNLNVDILVSLMVLVLSRSEVMQLGSELYYIQNFTYKNVFSGHLGYAVLTLEGVLYHITNDSSKLAELSSLNGALWERVKNLDSRLDSHLLNLKENPDFEQIVRSRDSNGSSCLMIAIQNKNVEGLRSLLQLNDVFTMEFIVNDKTNNKTTLLMAATEAEKSDLISLILDKLYQLPETEQVSYFSNSDCFQRTVGHYFFHAPWLIEKMGHLISWTQKDHNGQSPLFALCRCYDHPNYVSLLESAVKAWSSSEKGGDPNIMDHVDSKGNSLLHIIKDNSALEKVLEYQADVNWPNERGFTPLMIYSKYSRMNAALLISQQPLVDLERCDPRGLTALDLGKESHVVSLLDGKLLLGNRKKPFM